MLKNLTHSKADIVVVASTIYRTGCDIVPMYSDLISRNDLQKEHCYIIYIGILVRF